MGRSGAAGPGADAACAGLPAGARAGRTPVYGARVARLLALAVSTDPEGEARAALAKARALHHPGA